MEPYQLIEARFQAQPALQANLPGGLVPGRHRPDATGLRANYQLISLVPEWTTEGHAHEPARVQFSVFGPTAKAVGLAIRALCSGPGGFDRAPGCQRVAGPIGPFLDESEGREAAREWQATVDYIFHSGRTL